MFESWFDSLIGFCVYPSVLKTVTGFSHEIVAPKYTKCRITINMTSGVSQLTYGVINFCEGLHHLCVF